MVSNHEIIHQHKLTTAAGSNGGGAAVKECCRIIAATFLSLLVPLSFLLLARLSVDKITIQPQNVSFLTALYFYSYTPLLLTLLVLLVTIAALTHCLTGYNAASLFITERRRLCVCWITLSLMQFLMSLGVIEMEILNSYDHAADGDPVRRLLFAVGLHEAMVFWLRSVVRPAVDEAILGFVDGEGLVVEKVVLAAAFGNLWWRRLREEAEALVVVVTAEMGVAGGLGWWLYYLTAAMGAVRLVKGVVWVVTWLLGCELVKKVDSLPTMHMVGCENC